MNDRVKVKIGIVIPAFNPLVEYEFARMIPRDVSFHIARTDPTINIQTTIVTADHMRSMATGVLGAVKLLVHVKPDVIAYAFGMGAAVLGLDGEKRLVAEMQEESKVPCLTTASAQVEACAELDVRSVSVVSGHTSERTEATLAYLKESGISVINTKYVPEEEIKAAGGLFDYPQNKWLEHAIDALDPSADGVYIAGGAYRSLDILEEFEKKTGKVLITNPPPTLWACLRRANYKTPIPQFGALLQEHL